ncbi:ankyrin repeat domain-containing protein 61-like [Cotesia typhae]|uniref:ankyrin repeat domain-containing protein 61-like n=1 Tax=Cotesia typhae TaxID=2053667 RepID=UPI003D681507
MAFNNFDLNKIQELVKSGKMSVNSILACEQYGELSVLQLAIMNHDEKFIDLLLQNNVNVNDSTKSLGTALQLAVKQQNLDVVKKLVASGAEINLNQRDDPKTMLPLHLAVDCGTYDIAEFLVMSGAHVNAEVHAVTFNNVSYNLSTLNLAISKKDIRLVKLLLDNKAIIDGGSREVYSSLHLAARTNRVDILQILEQYGAKFEVIKDQEYTLEFIAALRKDNVDILHVFSRNCDNILDIYDYHGDTVAHLAVQLCSCSIWP